MEINHTRISGVSHCGPLSEQPTTSKPNGFLGFIPENVENMYHQPEYKVNPFYKQPAYQPIPLSNERQNNNDPSNSRSVQDTPMSLNTYQAVTSLKNEPLRSLAVDENNNEMVLSKGDVNYDSSRSDQLLNLNQQNEPSNMGSHKVQTNINYLESSNPSNINQRNDLPEQELEHVHTYPLPLFEKQQTNENEQYHKSIEQNFEDKSMEQPLNEQPIVQHLDPIVQQQQLNQLASQIEELRLKVEELTVQNKILSHTVNHSSSAGIVMEDNNSKIYDDKNITPEQIAIRTLSTEKIPDRVEDLGAS